MATFALSILVSPFVIAALILNATPGDPNVDTWISRHIVEIAEV